MCSGVPVASGGAELVNVAVAGVAEVGLGTEAVGSGDGEVVAGALPFPEQPATNTRTAVRIGSPTRLISGLTDAEGWYWALRVRIRD